MLVWQKLCWPERNVGLSVQYVPGVGVVVCSCEVVAVVVLS